MKYVKMFLPYIIVILIVFLIRYFLVSPIQVVGSSMMPTLKDGEVMLLNKIKYKFNDINRFDIVVVNKDKSKPIIKRVIGLPGESVEYIDNKLYVNGKEIKEDFKTNSDTVDYSTTELGVDVIPDGYYFVLGDNRGNSVDSRIIGLVSRDEIEGSADFVLFPLSKFGSI